MAESNSSSPSPTESASTNPPASSSNGDGSGESAFSTPAGIITGSVLVALLSVAAFLVPAFMNAGQFQDAQTRTAVAIAAICVGVLLGMAAAAMLIVGSIRWAMRGADGDGNGAGIHDEQVVDMLRQINDRLVLSETAKRIRSRHEDIQSLRRTIREDIANQNFDAALALITEMAQTYGYLEEAEAFREQVAAARQAETERKIDQAVATVEDIISAHDFARAGREIAKLQRLYPDSERVVVLSRRVVQARDQYKNDLERQFLEAAEREDVDRAMELLKEMDKYLTEDEAEQFREVARGVIGKQRNNLGVQFKMAVQDREWLRAVRVGEQIIQDFPNSRMADEVRGMLDALRERASDQQALRTAGSAT